MSNLRPPPSPLPHTHIYLRPAPLTCLRSRFFAHILYVGPGTAQHGTMPHSRRVGKGEVRAGAARYRVADQAHDWGRRGRVCGRGRTDAKHPREGVVTTAYSGTLCVNQAGDLERPFCFVLFCFVRIKCTPCCLTPLVYYTEYKGAV